MGCGVAVVGHRARMALLVGLGLTVAAMAAAAPNGKTLAEWKVEPAKTPVAELSSDGRRQLLLVDYLLSDVDGSYLNQTTLTVLGADSKTAAATTVALPCEVSTPRLLAFRKGRAYLETYVGSLYHLTVFKIAGKGLAKTGELQAASQFSVSVDGNQAAVMNSSWDEAAATQTLTARFYDLDLAREKRQLSCSGGYLSISPVKAGKPSAWELLSMTADDSGGIATIDVKLVK